MSAAAYSIVIATFERPGDLAITFEGIASQIHKPQEIVVVDSSSDQRTRELCDQWDDLLPVRWEFSEEKSAALQRNRGAELTSPASAVIGFIDDDITLRPNACELVCEVFGADAMGKIGGISVRIQEIQRLPPSRLTRLYYRLQAGYADATYGGKLFGPAINCLPCYSEPAESGGDLIGGEWLNSGCVFYRREPFLREKFPAFTGYSFMEDVHLSARIAKTHRLYFHTRARCSHREGSNALKGDLVNLARQRIRNQRIVARDVMGLRGAGLMLKLFLHRLFATTAIVRERRAGWKKELFGTWT